MLAKSSKISLRSVRGQHTVELVCALIFLVPFFLFLFDLTFVFLAGETNKQVCRDAARAAAEVIPSFPNPTGGTNDRRQVTGGDRTYRRAQSVVERLRTRSEQQWIRGISLDTVTVDLQPVPPNTFTELGGPIPGSVTVATTVRARPPAPIPGVFDQFTLTNQFTFDLTAVRPTTIIPNEAP